MSTRRFRLSMLLGVTLVTTGIGTGTITIQPSAVDIVLASSCHPVNDTCTDDTTKTSVLTVSHADPTVISGDFLVEPASGENWSIRAEWRTASGCTNAFETASCRVTWNGSGWSLSSVSTTANIIAISVCDAGSCSGVGGAHGHAYKLFVDITDPVGAIPNPVRNLYEVRYQTTSVDNGRIIASSGSTQCVGLGAAVSPSSQTFTEFDTPGDWGDFRCAYQCSTGGSTPAITLTYQ